MNTEFFAGKRVFVTGGTGFIGRNLAQALLAQRAEVTLLAHSKSSIDHTRLLTETAKQTDTKLDIVDGDIREAGLMKLLVRDKDFIFNLAALVSHKDEGIIALEDLDVNTRGHITLLEALQKYNRQAKIIFSSTRMVYGDDVENPIKETDATNPPSYYGISKLAAEKYHLLFHRRFDIPVTILRIGNPYGDGQHLSTGSYSIPGWFMQLAIEGQTVIIKSDGKQERDYIYIGDLVEILLRAATLEKTNGKIYNVGSGIRHTFGDMAIAISQVVPSGKFEYTLHPIREKGSYSFDISRLKEDFGWKPETKLIDGVTRMYEFALRHPKKS